jgi:hypothetical protein
MAYYHARANVCRAGVTYAGLADHPFKAVIGTTDRTNAILYDSFTITTALDGSPSTCAFTVQGFTPTKGHDVILTLGGELIWGGTLTEIRVQAQKFVSGAVFYACQAIDWTWLMDRYARVHLRIPENTAVNQAVASVLRDYTDGGFARGYVPMDLPDVGPIVFEGETVSGAIRRIAAAAGAFVRMRPQKRIDVFDVLPDSNALTLGNSSAIRDVVYEDSLSQVRTRTYYVGGGGTTTSNVTYSATTVPVDECGWYSGSQAFANGDVFSYTGRTVTSGPGSLTGVSGLAVDLPQGTTVSVLAQADDATAQTALATLLGGGRSGVAVGWFADGRLSQGEVDQRAAEDVAAFKSAIPALAYATAQRYHEPGKSVVVSTTDPVTISGTFRIQQVVMRPYGVVAGNTPSFEYQVTCRVFRRADILDG